MKKKKRMSCKKLTFQTDIKRCRKRRTICTN